MLRNLSLAGLALSGLAAAAPSQKAKRGTIVHPKPGDFTINKYTTINSTHVHNPNKPVAGVSPSAPLPLSFVNNYGGSNINAYLTGLDGDGAAFFLQSDGTAYYPPNPPSGEPPQPITADIAIPVSGSGGSVNLPNYVSSGRIYFSVGTMSFGVNYGASGPAVVAPSFENPSDPNADTFYGWLEFTWNQEEIYSNLSFVDFVGLAISQTLDTANDGSCTVKGLPNGAVDTICGDLNNAGAPWPQSCQQDGSGNNLRVLAPLHLMEVDSGALSGYYSDYVDQVWDAFTSSPLTITAGNLGNYTCQVSGDELSCNEGGSFAKPDETDIFGCNSGPFANPGPGTDPNSDAKAAIVPILCAAFDRSSFLVNGGSAQPDGVAESDYYPTNVATNIYSKYVHATETDGRGYTFAYDDVTPAGGQDVSGACVDANPTKLTVYVGGM